MRAFPAVAVTAADVVKRPIRVLEFLQGAQDASGATVVIDVFRAFSLVPWALMRGALCVVPVRTEEEALGWRDRDPRVVLAGEQDGRPLPGFDYANSPSALREADLSGRVLVHRSSAGTQGLLAAVAAGAYPVLAGSFLTAAASVRYLHGQAPDRISLVALGWNACEPALEDMLCAEYLRELLLGGAPDFAMLRERIRDDPSGQRFSDPALPWFPTADFDACMDLDRFDAAVVARPDEIFGVRLEAVAGSR